MVRRLLAAGAKTDPLDRMNKPAIVYAAGQGQAESIALLLDAGVEVNRTYEHGLTALMWAAGQGNVRSYPGALFGDWFFGDLDQNFLALVEQVQARVRALRHDLPGRRADDGERPVIPYDLAVDQVA